VTRCHSNDPVLQSTTKVNVPKLFPVCVQAPHAIEKNYLDTRLKINIFEHLPSIQVFAVPNLQVSPPATIPPEVMLTSYRPDLVFYNTATNSIALLELTFHTLS